MPQRIINMTNHNRTHQSISTKMKLATILVSAAIVATTALDFVVSGKAMYPVVATDTAQKIIAASTGENTCRAANFKESKAHFVDFTSGCRFRTVGKGQHHRAIRQLRQVGIGLIAVRCVCGLQFGRQFTVCVIKQDINAGTARIFGHQSQGETTIGQGNHVEFGHRTVKGELAYQRGLSSEFAFFLGLVCQNIDVNNRTGCVDVLSKIGRAHV